LKHNFTFRPGLAIRQTRESAETLQGKGAYERKRGFETQDEGKRNSLG